MFTLRNIYFSISVLLIFGILQHESQHFLGQNSLFLIPGGVHSLHIQNAQQSSSFKIINYHPEDWYEQENDLEDNSELSEHAGADELTLTEDNEGHFIANRNRYRIASFGKAIAAGISDYNRQNAKKELQLGYVQEKPRTIIGIGEVPQSQEEKKKIICYYNVPTLYDVPYALFPEQINPHLCTHIIIGFAKVVNYSLIPVELRDVEFYNRVVKLKLKNPELKVMIGVGSTNDGSKASMEFVNMMLTKESRGRFINQSIQFLEKYKFDGIEIDWEFPAFDGPHEQKDQLTALLTEFNAAFKSIVFTENQTRSRKYLLSAAVPAIKLVIDLGYDIPGIASAVDFIDLMCYDYHHYSWMTPLTGPNSPLFNESSEMGFFATLNMAWSTKYWQENGMPADKIIVGMPTYGHSFELADERYHNYYSVAKGFGSLGSNGFASFVPICNFLENGTTSVVLGKGTREPYAYRSREWVSFDNEQSAKEKANYVRSMNFGGMMFYSLNSDDAWKLCKSSKTVFPIVSSAKNQLLLFGNQN